VVEILPVSAADVTMTVDGTTIQLREAPPELPPCASEFPYAVPQAEPIGPGCYAARLPAGVRAGESYRLEVRIGGVLVAEGEAVVPAPPALSTPAPGDRYEVMMGPVFDDRPVPGILVRYELPPEVAGLSPSMRFDSVFVDGARETTARCNYDQFDNPPVRRTASVDSLVFVPRSLYCVRTPPQGGQQVFLPDSIFAHLSLAGFDEAYLGYDEAARQQSAELERLQAGVEGALGLFAGAGVAVRPVVLLPVEGAPGF
jgi:hypothetical protein